MTVTILFLVPPYANLFDMTSAAQVFLEAKERGLGLELQYCTFEKNIQSTIGLPLGAIPDYSRYKLKSGDYLFIASAGIAHVLSGRIDPPAALVRWIRDAHAAGVQICALCNAAFLLAHTGLLNGRNCTTHWKRTAQLQRKYPLAKVHENLLFIEDEGIYTSAGAASGVDTALHVVSRLKDEHTAWKISRDLVVYNRRSGHDRQQSIFVQYRNHVHTGIHRVQDWLMEKLDEKTTIEHLAGIACMSSRNLTRVFRKESGITINQYINLLRRERIRQLLKQPGMSRRQIARLCGLRSERQVSRLLNVH